MPPLAAQRVILFTAKAHDPHERVIKTNSYQVNFLLIHLGFGTDIRWLRCRRSLRCRRGHERRSRLGRTRRRQVISVPRPVPGATAEEDFVSGLRAGYTSGFVLCRHSGAGTTAPAV